MVISILRIVNNVGMALVATLFHFNTRLEIYIFAKTRMVWQKHSLSGY
jgi:hypothetical protein